EGATLLVRADANVSIGTGHVMRCLALGQAWQDAGGVTVFAMSGQSSSLRNRLEGEGFVIEQIKGEPGSVDDCRHCVQLVSRLNPRWVVLDGYHFSGDYQRRLKDTGSRLLVIDDTGHAQCYWADV